MKMVDQKTGKYSIVKKNEFGFLLYQAAANRLVNKIMPGHMAGSIAHYNLKNRSPDEIQISIVRNVGDMTERTGKTIWVNIIRR